jgi:hypothetical protein
MTAISFTTIAQPNPGGVLLVEIPEGAVRKLGAGKRVPACHHQMDRTEPTR